MNDTSFGVIPVWNDNGINKYLLIQSKNTNEWGFPKGHPEPGETEIESALRELAEETGITSVELIKDIVFTDEYSFDRDGQKVDKTVKLFVGKVSDPKVTIQEKEIADHKWATYDEALATLSFERPKEILTALITYLTKI